MQLNLFEQPYSKLQNHKLIMDKSQLIDWKTRITNYQQLAKRKSSSQSTLFDLSSTTWHDPDEIDPFTLKRFPADFYDHPHLFDSDNQGYLYFILDLSSSLILYIGETKLTPKQRWGGTHDCKSYLLRYIALHRQYQLPVTPCASFFYDLPPDKKLLRIWEKDLIYRWKPPFNKECWQYWSQPFG
jgi:hypothetical protein